MSRLYLRCGICGRQQAEGLLSRAQWGHVQRSDQTNASACPTCRETHADWEQRLRGEAPPANYGGSYQTA